MDTQSFWRLIEEAKQQSGGDTETQVSLLKASLVELPAAEIIAFDRIYDEMRFRAYDWGLWGAAYVINGGCSDDGFEYFRGWLIAQGEETFENAVNEPDSLAGVLTGDEENLECEDILYVARSAYEDKTGTEMPLSDLPNLELRGVRWADDDLPARYPRLFRLFAEAGGDEG